MVLFSCLKVPVIQWGEATPKVLPPKATPGKVACDHETSWYLFKSLIGDHVSGIWLKCLFPFIGWTALSQHPLKQVRKIRQANDRKMN